MAARTKNKSKHTTSDARRAANQRNAQFSTGPKTGAGKARSRANALKHGMTGQGIALPTEDAAAVELRFQAVQEELAPQTIFGVYFAHRMALMMVRTQRAERHEAAIIASRIRQAPADFDEARRAEADHLLGWIMAEPAAYRRKLLASPEGCDRLIAALLALRTELDRSQVIWKYEQYSKLEAFCGRRGTDVPTSRAIHLAEAINGNFAGIDPTEVDHLSDPQDRFNWACDQLDALITAEVATIEAHRATLDLAGIARDRAESADRALFDAGKEMTLARKYEAAATREFYRALSEFHVVEAAVGGSVNECESVAPAEPAAPTAATLLAGDQQQIDPDGLLPRQPKPWPVNDLERELGSFGTTPVLPAAPTMPGASPTLSRPDQPLDRANAARKQRLG